MRNWTTNAPMWRQAVIASIIGLIASNLYAILTDGGDFETAGLVTIVAGMLYVISIALVALLDWRQRGRLEKMIAFIAPINLLVFGLLLAGNVEAQPWYQFFLKMHLHGLSLAVAYLTIMSLKSAKRPVPEG